MSVVCAEDHHSDVVLLTRGDPAVAAIAERQEGAISIAQLRDAGLQRGALARRIANRRLHLLHRGVYAVGHRRLSDRGRLWAAVLACGGPAAAAISHRSAAAVWEIVQPPAGRIDVITLRKSHPTAKLRVHRSDMLDPLVDVVHLEDELPVTSVARTLVDLAAVLTPHQLERACHRAQTARLLDIAAIDQVLTRARRPRGVRALRAALATLANAEPAMTRRELEERFLALVAREKLPRPAVNVPVAGHEVDFLWPQPRLIVETDGAATHLTPTAFEADRRRDAELLLAGYRVVRFTWRQVLHEPHRVAATLHALLSAKSPPASLAMTADEKPGDECRDAEGGKAPYAASTTLRYP